MPLWDTHFALLVLWSTTPNFLPLMGCKATTVSYIGHLHPCFGSGLWWSSSMGLKPVLIPPIHWSFPYPCVLFLSVFFLVFHLISSHVCISFPAPSSTLPSLLFFLTCPNQCKLFSLISKLGRERGVHSLHGCFWPLPRRPYLACSVLSILFFHPIHFSCYGNSPF